MKRCLSTLAITLALAGLARAAGPTNDPLPALRALYDQKSAALEGGLQTNRQQAIAGYARDLDAMYRAMVAKGDEFGERPTREEAKRLMREKTVPEQAPPGTPELVEKARARYFAAVRPAEAEHEARQRQLAVAYAKQLQALRAQLEQAGSADAAARVAEELERVGALAREAAAGPAATRPPLSLPPALLPGLQVAYVLVNHEGTQVKDLSSRGHHGALAGTTPYDVGGGTVRDFEREVDAIGLKELRVGREWTLAARLRFPLERPGQPRVLMSSGYRQHHVLVDERGRLGVQTETFTGSAFDAGKLSGWHELVAVAAGGSTVFFIDGQPVGIAKAVCGEPVKSFANSAAGGQPWSGMASLFLLWDRALTVEEVTALSQRKAAAGAAAAKP